jgi:acyl-CoA reductase-like NAD-dependent aldehyde dehydrogenase
MGGGVSTTLGEGELTMTVGGHKVVADAGFRVINPATNRVLGSAPSCMPAVLGDAIGAAAAAFPSWATEERYRREALQRAAGVLREASDELALLVTSEQGKPLADAVHEVQWGADCLDYYAASPMEPEVVRDDDAGRVEVLRRPLGPVAAITPWNFPVSTACTKLAPALVTGNTVVLKPSQYTPLATLRLGELLREVFPPGVLNVVSGGDTLGRRLIADPRIRMVTLTGSTETGREVAAAVARDLKHVTLELGGNDAAIVLDDVDAARTARRLFWRAFGNCGQVCAGIKRVYVPRSLHDDFVSAMGELARTARVGSGLEDDVQMGPVNNTPQLERVASLVRDATSHGGVTHAGGHRMDHEGNFFPPTIISGVRDGVRLVDEEQFGPVLPVIAYDVEEDAVAGANATSFGLGGSVWSNDLGRGEAVARQLDCGTSWINTHANLAVDVPFSGHKASGVGVELGTEAIAACTDVQVIWTHRRTSSA